MAFVSGSLFSYDLITDLAGNKTLNVVYNVYDDAMPVLFIWEHTFYASDVQNLLAVTGSARKELLHDMVIPLIRPDYQLWKSTYGQTGTSVQPSPQQIAMELPISSTDVQ